MFQSFEVRIGGHEGIRELLQLAEIGGLREGRRIKDKIFMRQVRMREANGKEGKQEQEDGLTCKEGSCIKQRVKIKTV